MSHDQWAAISAIAVRISVLLIGIIALLSTASFLLFLVPGTPTWAEMDWYGRLFILIAPVTLTLLSVLYRLQNGEWPK